MQIRDLRLPRRLTKRIEMGAQNALELVRLGRLSARDDTPYEVLHVGDVYKLRRYISEGEGPTGEEANGPIAQAADGAKANVGPLLLIPPLMLTAEIYDIEPGLSAVLQLKTQGVDVWVVDFGAPEREEGGMGRTLDDHVKAVADAVRRVRERTGRDVHLGGYSQGGMFAYQAAAYLRSEGLRSVVTFGSPVDIHANVPLSRSAVERLLQSMRAMLDFSLEHVDGIPGMLSSVGFRMLTPGKELLQFTDFLRKLHDRTALAKRENRRRFLRGEGFVAWPGPALRQFVDEFIVHNRLMSGGLVIDGRTVTLADITCPILCFMGHRDDFARPRSVRGIRRAASQADIFEVMLPAGHFGLVVGSTSLSQTWPTVSEWLKWQDDAGPRPELIPVTETAVPEAKDEEDDFDEFLPALDLELFYDTFNHTAKSLWNKLGDWTEDMAAAADGLRWQLPKLAKLKRLEPHQRVSVGKSLADQARRYPNETFFLWQGRAFSYRQSDIRVDNIVRGLIQCGVRPGTRVGIFMGVRPTYLSLVAAVSRLGAVAVLIDPHGSERVVRQSLDLGEAGFLIADPDRAGVAQKIFGSGVLVLGGGGEARSVPPGCTDMEAIDPAEVSLPDWYRPNPGRAVDLAMILFSSGRFERPRVARITNLRWAFAAYGSAAAATLSPSDTVYSCLPLHHPSGILVSVGAGLVGGARIALAQRFSPELFWDEVRRYGATVAFYAGDVFRGLVDAPVSPTEHVNPLRLFAGSGIRDDVWRRIRDRFAVGVLEFYASTEGSLVLANASGEKVGSLGRPLPGSAELRVVRYDLEAQEFVRGAGGFFVPCAEDEVGMLLARVDATHPMSAFEGVREHRGMSRVRDDVFAPGDRWFVTGDLMRRDESGDYWLVDRLADMIPTPRGHISTRVVEDAIYAVPGVRVAAVYGVPMADTDAELVVGAIRVADGTTFDVDACNEVVARELRDVERPALLRVVDDIPMTPGFRPMKGALRSAGVGAGGTAYVYDSETETYADSGSAGGARSLEWLQRRAGT